MLNPAPFSSASTTSSVATALMVGAVGLALSILTPVRVVAVPVRLAASVAVTLTLYVPSAGRVAEEYPKDQLPNSSART